MSTDMKILIHDIVKAKGYDIYIAWNGGKHRIKNSDDDENISIKEEISLNEKNIHTLKQSQFSF